jgi:hypothetical protein
MEQEGSLAWQRGNLTCSVRFRSWELAIVDLFDIELDADYYN